MKKLIGLIGAGGAAIAIAAMAFAGTASAHAFLESSNPTKGQVLTSPPASVVLNFAEGIQTTSGSYGLTVTQDGGGPVTAGSPRVSGDSQLTVDIDANIGAGRYVVNWNNTSSGDGDAISGAFSFYINTTPTVAQIAEDQALDAIEGNQLATATAEAGDQATQTAAAGAPTAAPAPTTAPAAPTAAAPATATAVARRPALPSTGTGSGNGSTAWPWLALAVAAAAMGSFAIVAWRRTRG